MINTPTRGIGKTTVGRLSDYAVRQGLPLLEAARQASHITAIGPRPAALLGRFVALMDRLSAAVGGPVEELLGLVLSETGYQKQLRDSQAEEDLQRLANIEELLTVARDFDERRGGEGQLEAFLEETCLVNDTDAWETDADRVTLMTLHASKGLEFPVVYVTAVEEGLLPHERSREHPEQWEEERRLLFVGITRAQQELQLSLARYRDFRGQRKSTIPSSFLMELPRMEMDLESPATEEFGPSWVEEERQEVPARSKVAGAAVVAIGRDPLDHCGGVGQRRSAGRRGHRSLSPGHVGGARHLRLGADHRAERHCGRSPGDGRFLSARRPSAALAGRRGVAAGEWLVSRASPRPPRRRRAGGEGGRSNSPASSTPMPIQESPLHLLAAFSASAAGN